MATLRLIGELPTRWTSCPFHQHDEWELVLYLEGEGAITVGDEPVPFEPGVIVCLPPRIPHSEHAERGYRNFHLVFSEFVPPEGGVPRYRDDEHGTFRRLCELMLRERRLADPGSQAVFQHLAGAAVALLERWAGAGGGSGVVDALKAALSAGFRDPRFGVGDALRALPCVPDHGRRVFRAATGRTPLEWLTDLRLTEAQHLLASGSGVAEAAAQCGIADPYYFSRVFARRVGVSPSRWAARVRGG